MSTATKTKPQRTALKPAHRDKPDMKAWAARALARLKAQYGNRVTPDSATLFEDMRADKF